MRRVTTAGLAGLVLLAGGCTADEPRTPAAAPSSAAPAAAPAEFKPGADGIGDPYFPKSGNGGYDVGGYDLNLTYEPSAGRLRGTATITATATQDLSRFNLDLSGLTAGAVTVDGAAARHRADGAELVVTPARGVPRGTAFTVVVNYAGNPAPVGSEVLGKGGWLRTQDGAFALGQPESASSWYPVNDHPSDKATFRLAMTVPDGLSVLSNGVPGRNSTASGRTTWTWAEDAPMASYLSFVVIGKYRVESTTHQGKPMITAIPESLPEDGVADRSIAATAEVADYLASVFGPYPFGSYGGIVLDDERISFALENQTRPVYGVAFFTADTNTGVVAHEIAHQWFGDSVALERWQDIWLNEGFATYAEWLWAEHKGRSTVQAQFDRRYGSFDWSEPPGSPGPDGIFGPAVYQRGAMTVHALRKQIGDDAFFTLLKSWTAEHRNGTATTEDFIAAAERVSGKQLDAFFQDWLFGKKRPTY
jgi:aminopeptidase N